MTASTSLLSNITFRLNWNLLSTESEVAISNDFERNQEIEASQATIVLKNQLWTIRERMICNFSGGTMTILNRWLDQSSSINSVDALKYDWPRWTVGYITVAAFDLLDVNNNWYSTTLNTDLIIGDWQYLYFWGTDSYIWSNDIGTNLKFKDASNSERTLSELSSLSWANDKVKVSADDTTEDYLSNKITGWDGITVWITSPAWNEKYDIDIDLTDTNIFSNTAVADKVIISDPNGAVNRWFFPYLYSNKAGSTIDDADSFAITDTADSNKTKEVLYSVVKGKIQEDTLLKTENKYIKASTNVKYSADTERDSSSSPVTSYTKIKEIQVWFEWSIKVYFDLAWWWTEPFANNLYGRVYINWVAQGTERISTSATYTTYSEDFDVNVWDLIQLYYYSGDWGNPQDPYVKIRNFRIAYDETFIPNWTVNLD